MFKTCLLRSETSNNVEIKCGTTITLDTNPDIVLSYRNSQEMFAKNLGDNCALFNGYKMLRDKFYKVIAGDCLCVNEDVRYTVELQSNKRSRSPSTDSVAKKTKLAPIFQMKPIHPTKQLSGNGSWENVSNELLIYTPVELEHKTDIASFDLDNTLIKTKSGKVFASHYKDWMLINGVQNKLRDYQQQGYKLVIFTNQFHVGRNKSDINLFKDKITSILKVIACPIQVFVSLSTDIYRKPATGMWDVLLDKKNGDIPVNMDKSFYIGDAAGRAAGWQPKRKKDHSFADRLFALNIGLKFLTPEEFFLGSRPAQFEMPEFDPRDCETLGDVIYFNDKQELILMVGSPASGKSTFCERELKPRHYAYISNDTLPSSSSSINHLEVALSENSNAVIDNLNQNKASRKRFLDVAKRFNVRCRCFVMNVSKSMARHNNRFREITDKNHIHVNNIVLYSYFKHYEEPSLDEGFEEIVRVGFTPSFRTLHLEKLYRTFLMDT